MKHSLHQRMIWRKASRRFYENHRETERARYRLRYHRVKPKRKRKSGRNRAMCLIHYHVGQGNIKKPDRCSRCRRVGQLNAHHEDYSKPLVVKWLCSICHGLEHRIPDP